MHHGKVYSLESSPRGAISTMQRLVFANVSLGHYLLQISAQERLFLDITFLVLISASFIHLGCNYTSKSTVL